MDHYIKVPSWVIYKSVNLACDVYHHGAAGYEPVFRAESDSSSEKLKRLKQNKVEWLYIKVSDELAYRKHLLKFLADYPAINSVKKLCAENRLDLLFFPNGITMPESISEIIEAAKKSVDSITLETNPEYNRSTSLPPSTQAANDESLAELIQVKAEKSQLQRKYNLLKKKLQETLKENELLQSNGKDASRAIVTTLTKKNSKLKNQLAIAYKKDLRQQNEMRQLTKVQADLKKQVKLRDEYINALKTQSRNLKAA